MIKCVVWDLDDTLWHGTLRNGDLPVINEAVLSRIKSADHQGVLHSIASRNELEPALQMLESLDIASYFLYPQIDLYQTKATALRKIAGHLNIGMDTLAFVDNDPFERYGINRYLPEIFTCDVEDLTPLDEQMQNTFLESSPRRKWMHARDERLQAQQNYPGSHEDFLKECGMILTVRRGTAADLPRVRELAERTHQFNNLHQWPEAMEPAAYLSNPHAFLYVCALEDRFGHHGLVGAAFLKKEPPERTLYIDLFCVSCRVEGRGIAAVFLREAIGDMLRHHPDLEKTKCLCIKHPRAQAALLLKLMGFSAQPERTSDKYEWLERELPFAAANTPWITIRHIGGSYGE